MMRALGVFAVLLSVHASTVCGQNVLREVVPAPGYEHDKFGTQPVDIQREFRAYTVSFDSDDDDNGDGEPDVWGVPHWIAYQLNVYAGQVPGEFEPRPSPWMTDEVLFAVRIAPSDASYKNSGYSRGHLCMRLHGRRLGKDADWNTHTVLNACPQSQSLNGGMWLSLEYLTSDWADLYESVWIVTGPIFNNLTPVDWIGDGDEVRVAVPDHFFKIVVTETGDEQTPVDVLAFIYPHMLASIGGSSRDEDHTPYLVSVDDIEEATNLDFLTALPDEIESRIESMRAESVWLYQQVDEPTAMPSALDFAKNDRQLLADDGEPSANTTASHGGTLEGPQGGESTGEDRPGDGTERSIGGGGRTWMTIEIVLCLALLGFAVICLGVLAYVIIKIEDEWKASVIIRMSALTLIIAIAGVLVAAQYSAEQAAPVIGLLGTIAGYLLGSEARRKEDQPRSAVTKSGSTNADPAVPPKQDGDTENVGTGGNG